MHKKKILFTLINLNIGGVQKTLINILNNLDYSKYEVDVMPLEEKKDLINLIPKEVKVLKVSDYINLNTNNRSIIYRLDKNVSINKILRKYKNKFDLEYDIVVAFSGFNNYIDLIPVSVKSKKKIIWVHNDFYNVIKYSKFSLLHKLMYKRMSKKFKYFDKIVCVSDGVEKNINKLFNNKYSDKIVVINNCIDYDEILLKSNEKTNIKFDNSFNIVSTGRICKAKNFELLLNIHKRLLENEYNVKTYIIGDGIDKDSLKNSISINNLDDSFILLGSQKNPYPIMKKADLFVSTSLYESFGNTILESLILGVPVISTATSGSINISKYIAEKDTCMIANSNEELYSLVENAIKNKKIIKSLNLNEYNKKVMNSIYKLLS